MLVLLNLYSCVSLTIVYSCSNIYKTWQGNLQIYTLGRKRFKILKSSSSIDVCLEQPWQLKFFLGKFQIVPFFFVMVFDCKMFNTVCAPSHFLMIFVEKLVNVVASNKNLVVFMPQLYLPVRLKILWLSLKSEDICGKYRYTIYFEYWYCI